MVVRRSVKVHVVKRKIVRGWSLDGVYQGGQSLYDLTAS